MPRPTCGEEAHGLVRYHGCNQTCPLLPQTELEGMAEGEAFVDPTMIAADIY